MRHTVSTEMHHARALILFICAILLSSHPAFAQFTQQGPKLVGASGLHEGSSVSISADGNTAIVGGSLAFIWTRSGGAWSQQSPKLIGSDAVQGSAGATTAVAISADGNTAIVGVPRDNHDIGAVWIWIRSGNAWVQQSPKLVARDASVIGEDYGTHQGTSVALSADGNTAIVGSPGDNQDTGAVWIWTRSGALWTQQSIKLVGAGAIGGAAQGKSVAISADGTTAIVGGPGDNSYIYGYSYIYGGAAGAAWVWTRNGGLWTQQSKLVGAGGVSASRQGWSVALSAGGNTALVGGPGSDYGDQAGSAWVWTRNGDVWTQQGGRLFIPDFNQVLNYSAGGLGFSVCLSGDGTQPSSERPCGVGPSLILPTGSSLGQPGSGSGAAKSGISSPPA